MQGGRELERRGADLGHFLDDFWDVLLNLLMIYLVMKPCFFKEMDQFWISGLTSDFVILWRSWGTSEISWVFLPRCQVMPRSEEEESFWSRVISTIACDILSRHPAPVIPHIPPHCRCSKSLEAKHQRTSWESRESKQGVLCWASTSTLLPHAESRVCIRPRPEKIEHSWFLNYNCSNK